MEKKNGEGGQRAQISKKKRTHQPAGHTNKRRRKRARASKNDKEPGRETGKNDKDTYNPKPLKTPRVSKLESRNKPKDSVSYANFCRREFDEENSKDFSKRDRSY